MTRAYKDGVMAKYMENDDIEAVEWKVIGPLYVMTYAICICVVDGKHVLMDHTEEERTIAKVLANYLGNDVELAPRMLMPQNVRTPDYIVDGRPYELKTSTGAGKSAVFDMIKHGKGPASQLVINIEKNQAFKE